MLNKPCSKFNFLHAREYAFVGWHHILDIDKGIFTASQLKLFQCFLDQIANILTFLL